MWKATFNEGRFPAIENYLEQIRMEHSNTWHVHFVSKGISEIIEIECAGGVINVLEMFISTSGMDYESIFKIKKIK